MGDDGENQREDQRAESSSIEETQGTNLDLETSESSGQRHESEPEKTGNGDGEARTKRDPRDRDPRRGFFQQLENLDREKQENVQKHRRINDLVASLANSLNRSGSEIVDAVVLGYTQEMMRAWTSNPGIQNASVPVSTPPVDDSSGDGAEGNQSVQPSPETNDTGPTLSEHLWELFLAAVEDKSALPTFLEEFKEYLQGIFPSMRAQPPEPPVANAIDPKALLVDVPEEVISSQQPRLVQPLTYVQPAVDTIDPEFLAALPPDIREEVLAGQRAQRMVRGESSNTENAKDDEEVSEGSLDSGAPETDEHFQSEFLASQHAQSSKPLPPANANALSILEGFDDYLGRVYASTQDPFAQPPPPAANAIDPEFLAALPEDLRAEVLASQQPRPLTYLPPAVHAIDPEFLAALPPNIREEVIHQQRARRMVRGESSGTSNASNAVDNELPDNYRVEENRSIDAQENVAERTPGDIELQRREAEKSVKDKKLKEKLE